MDIRDIRKKNLQLLVEQAGSKAELARRSDTDPSYISQIIGGTRSASGAERSVGYELARKLERGMKKRAGWMDADHSNEALNPPTKDEYDQDDLLRQVAGLSPRSSELIAMPDDSMSGTIEEGDIVVADTADRIPGDGIYALDMQGRRLIRRLQVLPDVVRVKSDSGRYEDFDMPADKVTIIGRARWKWHGSKL